MKFPIRVDLTKGEILFFDADNEMVAFDELVAEANALSVKVEALLREMGERE